MLSLTIENKEIENIFLKEFHSDKEQFFNFIQSSFEKMKTKQTIGLDDNPLVNLQITSMSKTWDNIKDNQIITNSLFGTLKDSNINQDDYKDYLENKYL